MEVPASSRQARVPSRRLNLRLLKEGKDGSFSSFFLLLFPGPKELILVSFTMSGVSGEGRRTRNKG
jgi:hypothetical protein